MSIDLSTDDSAGSTPADEPEEPDEPEQQAPDIDLDDDWTLAAADDFYIGIPPGWFDGGRALEDDQFMADVAGQVEAFTDAELAGIVEENMAGVDILAFKIEDLGSDAATNINIAAEQRGPLDEPEVIGSVASDSLEDAGATSVVVDEYEVSGLPSIEVSYDLPDFEVSGIQNYVLTDDLVLIATYTAAEPDRELWLSILDTIVLAD